MCEWIKEHIFEYPSHMKYPKEIIYRIRGLQRGNFIANKNIKPLGKYSDEIIWLTFKIHKNTIVKGLRHNEFTNEGHKVNYVFKIIEKHINDTVLMMAKTKRAEEKVENMELKNMNSNGAEYNKKKRNVKTRKRLEDLL